MTTKQCLKVLVLGSGGREHALVQALKHSASTVEVHCAPGNDGIARDCDTFAYSDFGDLRQKVQAKAIDLVVVGPEQLLIDGVREALEPVTRVFGPNAGAAMLEGSKALMKEVAARAKVPTARHRVFDAMDEAMAHVTQRGAPIVIKADGLAAGKGVTVAMTLAQAQAAIGECFGGKFGQAGGRVIIEECLTGPEISLFHVVKGDGQVRFLGAAQDHKRLLDDDQGPNTGGMGTFSPSPLMTPQLLAQIEASVVAPVLNQMTARGTPFEGFLFTGLMLTPQGPKLLEFNVRMGDPETQSLMPLLSGDLAAMLYAEAGDPGDAPANTPSEPQSGQHAVTVVLAAPGYPDHPHIGLPIPAPPRSTSKVVVTVAGARHIDGQWRTSGGRVLGFTGLGDSKAAARMNAYAAIEKYGWEQAQFRTDIGR